MAFKAGTATYVNLDGVNGSGTNVSPYTDNFQWPQSVETMDVSVFGTAAKGFINGLTDGDTLTLSGPYDVAMHSLLTGIKAAQSAGSSTSTVLYGPGGSVSGQARVTAEVWLSSYQLSSGVGGRAEFSCSLQVTGAVTNGTF